MIIYFKKLLFTLLFLLGVISFTTANTQPRCVSVLANGNVTLSWSQAVISSGTFDSYLIYSSSNLNGPYTLATTITNLNQTTYTHTTVNANLAKVFYYIETRVNQGSIITLPALDTVSSIKLTVTNPTNGTAVLNWNAIASPNISSSTGQYKIYQEYPLGTWTLIKTIATTNNIDTIVVCNSQLNYRIEIDDASGCTSISSVDGGVFQNIIVPATPGIDTLSVTDNNNATMSWNSSSSSDVVGYVVYQFNGSAWIPIDTVWGINATNYTYQNSNAGNASEQYRLAALDSCGNISPLGAIKKTIYLTAAPDICSRSVILTWNDYGTIGTGLSAYNIYKSTTGATGPYSFIGTVASTIFTYTEGSLLPSTTYHYKIEAEDISGTKTVSSNRRSFYSASPIPPQFSYLRNVSVNAPNKIDLSCHVDVAASTKSYKIMRSLTQNATDFKLIATLPITGNSPLTYSDTKVNTDKESYYYKIINVDSCGFDGMETNISRSILLTAESDKNTFSNKLIWNDYESWLGNVASYNIYRAVDGIFNPIPVANVPYTGSGENVYMDDISNEANGKGVFSYYVEAVEGSGNIYGYTELSKSNIAEAYQDAIVYVPNAFKPGGINSIFIPVTTFVDVKNYEFIIFNRWGQKVFETNNINEGWDGNYAGKKAEFGVYVYVIRYLSARNEYIDRKGSVTLLR